MELQGNSPYSTKCLSNREIEVCKILLNLKKIIRQFDTIPPNVHWIGTKKRSLMDWTPNPDPLRHIYSPESKPMTSPNTPLSFSDEDQNSHPKFSKKRTREDMLEQIERLEQNRPMLREALDKVENHHRKLLALNFELKETKKQLPKEGQAQLDDVGKDEITQDNAFLTDSCNQLSNKPFRGIDLNEPPPLDDCEMEWS